MSDETMALDLEKLMRDEGWDGVAGFIKSQAKRIKDLEKESKTTQGTIKLAHYFLKNYTDDAQNATHAKRVLFNALIAALPEDTPHG